METLPLNTSDLCPLTTRLLPKELSHAFGIADEQSYDSRGEQSGHPSAPADAAAVQPTSSTGAAQLKRQHAPEQQQQQQTGVGTTAAGQAATSNAQQPQTVSHAAPSSQQQQATSSSISAGLQQQAALVGGQLRGFPAAYISSHPLLPYAQQTVAALPHLSGALPVAMYSPADLSAVMALQQQQAQQAAQAQAQQQAQLEEAEELQGRALKRPRLVWTPALHKLFEEAVAKIGVNKAVPKTIMQMMNVDGLTRENVASHLQKYRLSLRKGPDGEFITTVTEGTETCAADAAAGAAATNSAGGDGTTSAAAGTGDAAAAVDGSGSSEGAAGGVSSDAGTGAVAGSKGEGDSEEARSGRQQPAAAVVEKRTSSAGQQPQQSAEAHAAGEPAAAAAVARDGA